MWITWKVVVRETCFCEKFQADVTVSWVFQKYFNFVPMLELRKVDHVKSNCLWNMFWEKIQADFTVSWVFHKYFNFRQSLPRPSNDTSPRQFHESAIGQHLLDNAKCASHYNKDKFSVLARARTPFHLSVLEATFIKSLKHLCKQK